MFKASLGFYGVLICISMMTFIFRKFVFNDSTLQSDSLVNQFIEENGGVRQILEDGIEGYGELVE